MLNLYDLIIIGGGAAGIFAAISAKQGRPSSSVLVLEKTAVLLSKVRISGGGRCNVTHACFEPKSLAQNYPRGHKQLIGLFHKFGPQDTIDWFAERGVKLKTERDGRIFPVTDSSQTIIHCLLSEAKKLGVEIQTTKKIESIEKQDNFQVELRGETLHCKALLLASGSNAKGHSFAEHFGHTIEKPVPSLFTFNVPNSPLKELSGISVDNVEIKLSGTSFVQKGPLLLTHFGFSGPAALKLSAWGARTFAELDYKAKLIINWMPEIPVSEITDQLLKLKQTSPQKQLSTENIFYLPKGLWKHFSGQSKIREMTDKALRSLAQKLHHDVYLTDGKTTNKEEFVTCGGVKLSEVDFQTMESKICPNLFFAGEILDIDGITGGFNFQNAWATGFVAGSSFKN